MTTLSLVPTKMPPINTSTDGASKADTSQTSTIEFLRQREDARLKQVQSIMVSNDISLGQEKFKIPAFNEVTFEQLEPRFNYVLNNIRRPQHAAGETICLCPDGDCNTNDCSCYTRSTIKLKFRTELHYFENKGYGIRTRDYIPKGSFFCEFVGELLLGHERTNNVRYQYSIQNKGDEESMPVIDAKLTSNISRFINHSCDPSLSPFIFVRSTKSSIRFPQIGFVANQDIIAGQEVTISYGNGYWELSGMECYCGRTKCIKPSIETKFSNKAEFDRAELEEKEETSRNQQLVDEYRRCKQRMEMIKQGFTVKEVFDREAKESKKKKSRSKPKEVARREHRPDSPFVPPSIICLD
ncbi:Histone-lysine N-methyltransferase EHMT1 isoform X4 [Aphelenchoides besseyi]|nr:Histone-lysine N-methyltransferase EHMT1 isoform X4 [Aphelenchoides besseyi]